MSAFNCPYCSEKIPDLQETKSIFELYFGKNIDDYSYKPITTYIKPTIQDVKESHVNITIYHCPNCREYIIFAKGTGRCVKDVDIMIRPLSAAKKFPLYVPEAIRNDYEEAYAIVNLSPKASATLLRRCLQGMIRDFHNINENNLSKAINKLQGIVDPQIWEVIEGTRRLGNIGAHMEKDINLIIDIEPEQAKKLLKLIEYLIEQWYINRHEREKLFSDIINIDNEKQRLRKEI